MPVSRQESCSCFGSPNQRELTHRPLTERTVAPRRIEDAHVDAGFAHLSGQPMHAGRSQPIVEHTDAHALARFLRQRVGELATDVVGREDVHLEQDLPLGRANRREPCRKILFGVEQQLDRVALARRRARRALQSTIADLRERIGT